MPVAHRAVDGVVNSTPQRRVKRIELHGRRVEALLDSSKATCNPILLLLQQIDGHGSRVVSLK
ncbi:hypothetical protein HND25_19990 [Rhodococcus erythropolis]|uniref:hypothetical protein n=1 Tax=Rhodococcus erythropolis TaxID=1833 RepID=UPI000766E5CD|nr:hypothetical protein [Rhodococcus erythropolis]MBO8148661.1 hypothetical protein [Rhodococcus erythropolis]MDO1490882.1 hypothetical protein [Rhodococcus erythropolis]